MSLMSGSSWRPVGVGVFVAVIGLVASGRWRSEGVEAPRRPPEVIPLWPLGTPGTKGNDPDKDLPTLSIYRPKPDQATGAAVVVCPGGGYGMLAVEHEGKQVAEWLNSLGVTAFVLKYRLGPRYHHPAMLEDAGRAIRTVRAGAEKWGLDPHRVAIIGFSAGGHLASTAGTHFDAGKPDADDPIERASSRPDRVISGLPRDRAGNPLRTFRLAAQPAGRQSVPRADREPVERTAGHAATRRRPSSPTPTPTRASPPRTACSSPWRYGRPACRSSFISSSAGGMDLGLGGGTAQFKIPAEPSFQAWPKLCETWLKNQGFLDRVK